jgi:hypothetical protein
MGTVKLVKDEWLDDWHGFLKEVKSDIVGEYGHVPTCVASTRCSR